MTDDKIRLQKYMSECGIASRRKSEELISAGKVKVNGAVASIGDKIDPKKDVVSVSGRKINPAEKMYYIMLNKPRGFITTMSDEMDRKCVASLVSNINARIYPIGRLDRESEGLLLFTNDGEFANDMMHPAKHVPKTYRVTVKGSVPDDYITQMMTGMMIEGRMTLPAQVNVLKIADDRTVLEIILCEGRNRQIRKMCEELNMEVLRLKRTAIGNLHLGMLKTGTYRELTSEEIKSLKNLVK